MTADEGVAAERVDALDWIRRIASGDRCAEAEFVRCYERGVRALVRRRCRPGDPAVDDIAQEVLTRVLERLRVGAIRDPSALPAYVQAMIVRAASSQYHSERLEVAIVCIDEPSAADDPAEQAGAAQRADLLRLLMQSLPVARDRDVLVRFYLDEQDRDEVCASLGIDTAHFRRVVFRARERFRELLLAAGLDEH